VHDEQGRVVGSATAASVVRALDRLTEPDEETDDTAAVDAPVGTLRR
jgi:osmoprotectant transport system ATP-binding protein